MLWLVQVKFRKLRALSLLLLALGVVYMLVSPSTTPAMTYSVFLFILSFPVCAVAFEGVVFELKNPVSRFEYSLGLMLSYLPVFLIPLVPFVNTRNFLNAVLTVVSGVSAGIFFGSAGFSPKLSAVLPVLFLLTFIPLFRLSPLLSFWNPLLAVYYGAPYQILSIGFYSSLYFAVMKKREWRG